MNRTCDHDGCDVQVDPYQDYCPAHRPADCDTCGPDQYCQCWTSQIQNDPAAPAKPPLTAKDIADAAREMAEASAKYRGDLIAPRWYVDPALFRRGPQPPSSPGLAASERPISLPPEPVPTCQEHPGDYALEGHCPYCDHDRAEYRKWRAQRDKLRKEIL